MESLFKPNSTQLAKPPTNRQALNVARNAIHTLIHSRDIGGNCLDVLAQGANEPSSDLRYAWALLDRILGNEASLQALAGNEECSFGATELDRQYHSGER